MSAIAFAAIGAAIGIAGRIVNNRRTVNAIAEARRKGLIQLKEGRYVAGQNADDVLQDTKASIALSGVAMDEGTALQVEKQNRIQKEVTMNRMTEDFNNWDAQMDEERRVSNLNLGFGIAGDSFSFMANMFSDPDVMEWNENRKLEAVSDRVDTTYNTSLYGDN